MMDTTENTNEYQRRLAQINGKYDEHNPLYMETFRPPYEDDENEEEALIYARE